MQHGSNAGISGLVAFTGSPKFHMRIFRWQRALGNDIRPRNGRGTGRWAKSRPMRPNGNLVLSGKIRLDGWPMPTDWRGQEGTITAQLHLDAEAGLDVKETIAVRVLQHVVSLDDKTLDTWDVKLVCEITSIPVPSGFSGSQPAADVPAGNRQEVYDGLSKTIDPDDLGTGASQSIDIWMIGDTDAAEMQVIAEVIAAATVPVANTKLRQVTFTRTDADGGYISLTYSKTTSAEDQINAATQTTIDPSDLQSNATTAAINAEPAAPTGPGTASLVPVQTATRELNDQNILKVTTYGLRTTEGGIEQDASNKEDDPQDINDSGIVADVTTSGTPPAIPTAPVAGTKHRRTVTRQLNNGHWLHIFLYGRRNSMDDLLMEAAASLVDPNGLTSTAIIPRFTTTDTPPATPAAPTDTKFVDRAMKQIHDTAYLWMFRYGVRNSEDDIILPRTQAIGEVSGGIANTIPSIISSGSAYMQALSTWQAYKGDVTFKNVTTHRLTDGRLVQVVAFEDAYQIVQFQANMGPNRKLRFARISGGNVQVFLRDKIQIPGSRWQFRLGMQYLPMVDMSIILHRKVAGGTLPMFWNLSGTCNSAEFLGLAAKTVAYLGNSGQTNIAIPPPRVSTMGWAFYHDSNGFADESTLPGPMEWVNTATNLAALTVRTWVNASDLGLSASALATGDYSAFLV